MDVDPVRRGYAILPAIDRALLYVNVGDDCWMWGGAKDTRGYGRMAIKAEHRWAGAHRVVYEHFRGPIPEGLQLDHLCRVPSCVKPSHLEPVTCRVNLLRGKTITARRAAQTHCRYGHEYTPENTKRDRQNRRTCLECRRDRDRARAHNPSRLAAARRRYEKIRRDPDAWARRRAYFRQWRLAQKGAA